MEPVAVADAKIAHHNNDGSQKKNRIQVSNTKKPLFFYVNLAKKYMRQYDVVELSALGMAITTVVTISEILKNNGLAIQKSITTSTVDMKDETKGKLVQKAKIEIFLEKTDNFETLMTTAAAAPVVANASPEWEIVPEGKKEGETTDAVVPEGKKEGETTDDVVPKGKVEDDCA
ncbi:hypothetical protein GIB67_027159 [Kingdonia uniflora]|uniref:DNA/RNA-binding protein Alba-like domain-containing protein n=1 Tax=Kingdonia uniflora TaxID=39325 RepID=A0A7J7P2R6_9MAGN|nr:hypothetical protein GIB67_027159 [Kingdonia uniflora]